MSDCLDIFKSFGKYSKQNFKRAESSKLPSPNKKELKHSKMTRAASTKTTFKYEWKKAYHMISFI